MKSIAAINKTKDVFYKNVSSLLKGDLLSGKPVASYESTSLQSVTGATAPLTLPTSKSSYCVFFKGTDVITAASGSHFAFGTGDYTIEFWLNAYDVSTYTRLLLFSDDKDNLDFSNGNLNYWNGTTNTVSTNPMTANTWYHIALVRSSGTVKVYQNGNLVITQASTPNTTLARSLAISSTNFLKGYITDLRIVKGQAIYTSSFYPPIFPLSVTENGGASPSVTPVPSNVVLMALNSATLTKDSSLVPLTLTATATPTVIEFSTSAVPLGRLFGARFTGGGHLRTSVDATNFNLAGSNYTIEMWFYKTGAASGGTTLFHANAGSSTGTHVWINGSNQIVIDDGFTEQNAFTTVLSNYTWYHLAIVRSSTTTTAYLNGTSIGSNTYPPGTSDRIYIGYYSGIIYFEGYISNFRVVKGQALYTAAFSRPTTELTSTFNGNATPSTAPTSTNVHLLALTTSNILTDSSPTPKTITTGVVIPTSVFFGAVFGTSLRKTACNQNELFSNETIPLSTLPSGTSIIVDQIGIGSGADFTFLRTTAGVVLGSGMNDAGQLGDGSLSDRSEFRQVLTGVKQFACGDNHAILIKSNSTAWSVGRGDFGQLGNGSTTFANSTPIQTMTNVMSAVCGDNHTIFIKNDNTAWACGWNSGGQLGNNGDINISTPVQVLTTVRTAAAGTSHTVFVKTDNTAWGTGLNNYNQIGAGSSSAIPYQIMTGVASVVCGPLCTFFIKTDNSVWACGDNFYGQLGTGNTTHVTTPVQVMTGVRSVAAGETHTIFVKTDNSAWAVGQNQYGQLGDGTTSDRSTPIQIATGIDSAACGFYFTFLEKTDGSTLAVGRNYQGQMGNGNYVTIPTLTSTLNFQSGYNEYSGFFDVGSYLTIPNNTAFSLPGDFTIECWWKSPETYVGTNQVKIWTLGSTSSPNNGLLLYADYNGNLKLWSNGALLGTSTIAHATNTWYHLAVVRQGTALKLYINGQAGISLTNSTSFASHASNGFIASGEYSTAFTGSGHVNYISNLRIVKGQALYTTAFTPPTSRLTLSTNGGATPSTAPNPTAVSLLALTTPNVYEDLSIIPKSVSRTGDVVMTQYQAIAQVGKISTSTISPWSNNEGYWSGYFDANTDRLSTSAGSKFQYGTGAFTIEAWVNMSSFSTDTRIIFSQTVSLQNYLFLGISTTGKPQFIYGGGAGTSLGTSSITCQLNRWHHIAVVRTGIGANQTTLYVDGQLAITGTCSFDFSNTTYNPTIGGYTHTDGALNFDGYISNLRIVKGQALYTSAFTPSTIPIRIDNNGNALNTTTPLANNTSLLTLQNNKFTKVDTYAKWNEAFYAGFFSSSSNYLNSSYSLGFDTGAFTIECWINPSDTQTGHAGLNVIVGDFYHQITPNRGWRLNYYKSTGISRITFTSEGSTAAQSVEGADTIPTNAWTHVAVTRDSSNIVRIYYNGILAGSGTIDRNVSAGSVVRIGYADIDDLKLNYTGYISNLRIVKGQALYTQNFTTPTANLSTTTNGGATPSTLPTAANVQLLMLQSSNILTDNSPTPKTFTAVGTPTSSLIYPVTLSTTGTPKIHNNNPFNKFKLQKSIYNSGYFNGSSYLSVAPNTGFTLSGDFTIEFWVNTSVFSLDTNARHFVSMGTGAGAANLLVIGQFTTGGGVSNVVSLYTTSAILVGGIVVADGGWHHIAVTRSGTNLRLYVDGVQSGSTVTNSQSFNAAATTNVQIGRHNSAENGRINGYLANLRIINGIAVYTGAFTPPIAPVQTSGAASAASYTSTTNVNTTFQPGRCVLLLDFDDAGVFDSSGNNAVATYLEARSSDVQSKWRNKQSLYFDGNTYLTHTLNSNFGTGDFTVEAWVRPSSSSTTWTVLDGRTTATNNWLFGQNTANRLAWYTGSAWIEATSQTVAQDCWNHIMYTRSNGVGNLYCNGVRLLSATDSVNYSLLPPVVYVGANYTLTAAGYFNGYMDDLRITNGTARVTGATYKVPSRQAPTR